MHGYSKEYFLIVNICRMSFFIRGSHVEETEVEVTGTEAQGGLGSQYILMLTLKSLANCSMLDFLIGLDRE